MNFKNQKAVYIPTLQWCTIESIDLDLAKVTFPDQSIQYIPLEKLSINQKNLVDIVNEMKLQKP